jgi:ABC-type multidrug transport system fused ATPase/permease subunit
VELQGVTARYPDSAEPAIQAVNLTLEAGMSAAIVGPTGAGKSTLADVVLGILPVESGIVRLGSLEPSECISTWPGSIAYVPQVVSLVSGTVRQNVAIGLSDEEIDDDAVWSALRAAHLDDFLRSEREGLDTEVGERGVRLSGGQRQRLGLARALYSKPRLLVLDEATSALDAETEGAISNTLSRLHGDVTTIVIAHRLTTIKDADTVVYIDGGRVLAQGAFETVRQLVPRFDESARILGL